MVLAAGTSTRFGSDKRRHVLEGGGSLLQTTLAKYADVFENVVVVVRAGDDALASEIAGSCRNCTAVIANDAHLGMGHSLVAGVRAAGEWDYAFVALGDMPYVERRSLEVLRATMEAADADTIILPTFEGRAGHPVGFGSAYFADLQKLSGDAGARDVITRHRVRVTEVPLSDPGVLQDIDRPDDVIV